jgi:tripartite-type tricarboxylate transporter receptor subunit TctC
MLMSLGTATAQYPNKPITMYVAFAAGGTADVTARALADRMEKILRVPVIVENKAGAGGTISGSLVALKKPDGYSLWIASTGLISMRPMMMKIAYNSSSFTPIIQYSEYVGSVVVRSDASYDTIEKFIEHAKKNPGMTYASGGVNTQQQIGMTTFEKCKNLTFRHVPYNGAQVMNTALLGSHVDFMAGTGSHLPFVQKGDFKEILVLHRDTRDPSKPNIPTMKDIGCPPSNPAMGIIVAGPAGIPEDIVKKLEQTFKSISEEPSFQELLSRLNLPYTFKNTEQLKIHLKKETEWYKKFLTENNLMNKD